MNDDNLHHAPKPAGVGLGPDGQAATAQPAVGSYTDDRFAGEPGFDPHADAPAREEPGISDLLKNLRDESIHLIRSEVALAKEEVAGKANFFGKQLQKLAIAGVLLAIAGIALLSAIAFLIGGLIDAIFDDKINPSAANGIGFLLLSLPLALIGYLLLSRALEGLQEEPITPERTLQSLKDDKQWLTSKSTDPSHPTQTAEPA
jgi:hypothetical protein